MGRFLCFQRGKPGADGARYVTPIIKHKARRFGPVLAADAISRKRPVLITGAHDSGKSRWLDRLAAEAPGIWGKKSDAAPVLLGALRPLASWTDAPAVAAWWDAEQARKVGAGETATARPWAKLKPWEQADALPGYLASTGAVLFVDDAHKLTGRKLDIARKCAIAARLWVVAASEESRIAPNLRGPLLRRDPQLIRLDSEAAYDATNLFMWAIAVALLAAGAWEAGLAVAGLKALAGGRRAARQDG